MSGGIKQPTALTLKKYGLDAHEWAAFLLDQGEACGACGEVPVSKRLFIDHEHVKGWKAMPPEQRKLYVRGLLCYMCNKYRLARGATVARLLGAAMYLQAYHQRRVL